MEKRFGTATEENVGIPREDEMKIAIMRGDRFTVKYLLDNRNNRVVRSQDPHSLQLNNYETVEYKVIELGSWMALLNMKTNECETWGSPGKISEFLSGELIDSVKADFVRRTVMFDETELKGRSDKEMNDNARFAVVPLELDFAGAVQFEDDLPFKELRHESLQKIEWQLRQYIQNEDAQLWTVLLVARDTLRDIIVGKILPAHWMVSAIQFLATMMHREDIQQALRNKREYPELFAKLNALGFDASLTKSIQQAYIFTDMACLATDEVNDNFFAILVRLEEAAQTIGIPSQTANTLHAWIELGRKDVVEEHIFTVSSTEALRKEELGANTKVHDLAIHARGTLYDIARGDTKLTEDIIAMISDLGNAVDNESVRRALLGPNNTTLSMIGIKDVQFMSDELKKALNDAYMFTHEACVAIERKSRKLFESLSVGDDLAVRQAWVALANVD